MNPAVTMVHCFPKNWFIREHKPCAGAHAEQRGASICPAVADTDHLFRGAFRSRRRRGDLAVGRLDVKADVDRRGILEPVSS